MTQKPLVLIDLSNIAYAMFFAAMGEGKTFYTGFTNLEYCQYLVFKRIKELKLMVPDCEVVIAVDSGSWRKDVFKHYKCQRKLQRAKSKYNMSDMFNILNNTIKALKTYFPYKTIQVHNAEADDIIGTLVCYFKSSNRKIVIVSRDRDFMQLQRIPNVTQYEPVQRTWIKCDDPAHYLISHIISGDSGDSIPNILSKRDTFAVSGLRQTPCGPIKIEKILDYGLELYLEENETAHKNYLLNRKLVELSEASIPEDIQEEIKYSYNNYKVPEGKPYMILQEYFDSHDYLSKLSEEVFDFI